MESFIHHAAEHGLWRAMSRRSRLGSVVFSLLGLLWLGLFIFNVLQVQNLAARAALYDRAPLCREAGQTGCRAVQPVTIILITERTQGRATRHDFLVLPPDEIAVTVREAEAGLLPYAHEGATVEAEYWQGKIVRLRDAAGHESRSWDDPDWLNSNNTIGVVVTAALSLSSFGLVIYTWRQARRRHS